MGVSGSKLGRVTAIQIEWEKAKTFCTCWNASQSHCKYVWQLPDTSENQALPYWSEFLHLRYVATSHITDIDTATTTTTIGSLMCPYTSDDAHRCSNHHHFLRHRCTNPNTLTDANRRSQRKENSLQIQNHIHDCTILRPTMLNKTTAIVLATKFSSYDAAYACCKLRQRPGLPPLTTNARCVQLSVQVQGWNTGPSLHIHKLHCTITKAASLTISETVFTMFIIGHKGTARSSHTFKFQWLRAQSVRFNSCP